MLKILYLDDESTLCEIFKENFESESVQIWTFSQPAEALKAFEQIQPDLVLLDYRLPSTTGDVIASQLPATVPKALITGDLLVNPVSAFVRVFNKPFDFDDMNNFIESMKK